MRRSGSRFSRRSTTINKHWYGVATLSDSDYYVTSGAPSGLVGSASGFFVQCWVRLESQTGASGTRIICSNTKTTATADGWQLATSGTNTSIFGACFNGSGVQVVSALYSVTGADVGRWIHVAMVHNGTQLLLYVDGAAVGSPQAITGYNVSTGPTYIGRRSIAGNPATACDVAGLAGGRFVPSSAEILAARNAGLDAYDIVAIPSKTDHLWSVKQDQTGLIPATITDRVGANNMTKNGSPTLVSSSS